MNKYFKVLSYIILTIAIILMAYKFMVPANFGEETVSLRLQTAVYNGDLKEVEKILDKYYIDLNDEELFFGHLPLFIAVEKGNKQMVSFLVERGADVNKEIFGRIYSNAMIVAIDQEDIEMIELLVSLGYDIKSKNHRGENPLIFALKREKSLEIIEKLVELGVELDDTDDLDKNPLHWAALSGSQDIYDYLLTFQLDEWEKTDQGETMIHLATKSGNLQFLKYIISRGFDVYAKNNLGQNILFYVSNYDVLNYLYTNYDLNLEVVDNRGFTPLFNMLVIENETSRREIVDFYLEKGIDVNYQNNSGISYLHQVVFMRDYYLVKRLLEKGIEVNKKDDFGRTPLHIAVETFDETVTLDIVKALLETGADKSIRDIDGNTPLDIAMKWNNRAVIELLR
ncbi:ankyrin repeat domain-containing protein [Anaerobranca gottschalkii]|uniref:Ankyrin repeat n=1 Tax=Anaerobranca gottschalkii DSM 13577 TaxID=1120990 RepID=A0A1I0CPR5_9FIRM|nr:ankyrin repeat domain-containing protein [Anaerobranca gottschalkii]SET21646.1 Ankyrin repeat [Anaerobranca gottschalkii DSM 13577]